MTRLQAVHPEVWIQVEARDLCFILNVQPAVGPIQLPVQWAQGAKWLGVRLIHSPPSSAQVKYEWSHISTVTLCLCSMHSDSFMIYIFLPVVNSHENFKPLSHGASWNCKPVLCDWTCMHVEGRASLMDSSISTHCAHTDKYMRKIMLYE